MLNLRIIFLFFLCAILAASASAAELNSTTSFELPLTHKVTIKSPQGIAYELVISLPASYKNSPNKRYPILYYTDAQWDAPLLNSIYQDLAFDKAIPELVMVGITYAGVKPNYTVLRTKDLTPTKDENFVRDSGGGEAFLTFIKETIIHKVESEYRVDSTQRAIAGWSFGGLFALYAMYSEPDLFKRCIAVSPAVSWDDEYISQLDDKFFKANSKFSGRLFISHGANEAPAFVTSVSGFQDKVKNRKDSNLQLMNYRVENMAHAGAKASAYAQGLVWAWKDIQP
ncbi:alpha/beta hydrolase [Cellvibrio fontiphilus]|uniref:Alpha/beta hydrolase n=1 Tax=Cellvibrio fontiphilus TaxID=1815559 RepID=A0ABV7FCT0_9GAMM